VVVEQGTSFTVIDSPHPTEGGPTTFDARRDFYIAHRVWLGATGGTDWLHDAIATELGENAVAYEVESRRDSAHVGAAGEIAVVALILLGRFGWEYVTAFGARLGEGHAERALDWGRGRSRDRRKERGLDEADGPPDFFERDIDSLAAGMTGELADVTGVPEPRLELVSAERRQEVALAARYRDRETGHEYEVVAGRDSATFKRIGAPEPPPVPRPDERPVRRRRFGLPWRRRSRPPFLVRDLGTNIRSHRDPGKWSIAVEVASPSLNRSSVKSDSRRRCAVQNTARKVGAAPRSGA
jgi:hypothetical protein